MFNKMLKLIQQFFEIIKAIIVGIKTLKELDDEPIEMI